ncbi:hypothetical protein [Thermocladium modestius]|nr:hypothetical protein [Thermocladium modestius]
MSCPKCGSHDISIMAGEPIMFLCKKCGNQWPASIPRPGYVKVGETQYHWTEVEATKEKMITIAGELLRSGSSASDVVDKVAGLNSISKLLPREEVERIVKIAISIYGTGGGQL